MTAGQGQFRRPPGLNLPPDLGQIRTRRRHAGFPPPGLSIGLLARGIRCQFHSSRQTTRPPSTVLAQQSRGFGESSRGHDVDVLRQSSFRQAVYRDHDPAYMASGQRRHHGQEPGHRTELPTERQLSEHRPPAVGGDLLRPEQDAQSYRKVQ